jgi:hypothetical protein
MTTCTPVECTFINGKYVWRDEMRKTIFSLVMVSLALSLLPVNIQANKTSYLNPVKRRLIVSFYLAGISGGPMKAMERAMIHAGFDESNPLDSEYPKSRGPSSPSMISVGYLFKPSFGVGIILSRSDLGGVQGHRYPWMYVRTEYSVTTIAPIFFVKAAGLKLGIGPAFHSVSSIINENTLQKRQERFGFVADFGFVFPEKSLFFMEIKTQYRFVGKVEIGPYEDKSVLSEYYPENISHSLPATTVNYSHWFIGAGIGFRF